MLKKTSLLVMFSVLLGASPLLATRPPRPLQTPSKDSAGWFNRAYRRLPQRIRDTVFTAGSILTFSALSWIFRRTQQPALIENIDSASSVPVLAAAVVSTIDSTLSSSSSSESMPQDVPAPSSQPSADHVAPETRIVEDEPSLRLSVDHSLSDTELAETSSSSSSSTSTQNIEEHAADRVAQKAGNRRERTPEERRLIQRVLKLHIKRNSSSSVQEMFLVRPETITAVFGLIRERQAAGWTGSMDEITFDRIVVKSEGLLVKITFPDGYKINLVIGEQF